MEPEIQAPPPAAPPPGTAAPTGRPTGATVVAVIAAIEGVLLLLLGVVFLLGAGLIGGLIGAASDGQVATGVGAFFAGLGIVFAVIIGAIGLLYLAVAYGVWGARRWSWMLGVVVYAIALAFGVLGLGGGFDVGGLVLGIVIPVLVLFLLWQPEVKRYLGRA